MHIRMYIYKYVCVCSVHFGYRKKFNAHFCINQSFSIIADVYSFVSHVYVCVCMPNTGKMENYFYCICAIDVKRFTLSRTDSHAPGTFVRCSLLLSYVVLLVSPGVYVSEAFTV